MTGHAGEVPVVLCIYNRPDFTRRVADILKAADPERIFIVADGPKSNDPDDAALCAEALRVAEERFKGIRVEVNASASNLGSRKRIQSGLTWVFGEVDEAIIIEDDCLPEISFFPFCAELIEKYRHEKRVGLIGGSNFQFERRCGSDSYFFSRYPLMWGWAAWRRTWEIYEADLESWTDVRDTSWLADLLVDPLAAAYWRRIFDLARDGFDAWDYSMIYSCWRNNLLSIQPCRNLVSNIGFGSNATNTREKGSPLSNIPFHKMIFPLSHPARIERHPDCDNWTEEIAFSGRARKRYETAQRLRSKSRTGLFK